MIETQINSDEPNNIPMRIFFFVIWSEESTTKEEHVEIEQLIMTKPIELVALKEDEISIQTSSFIDFVWLKWTNRSNLFSSNRVI